MPLDNLDYSIVEDYNGLLLESAQLDLEHSNQLLPSPTRSDIIGKHLSAIRTQFPAMENIKHKRKWMAGRLIMKDCKKTINESIELITASEYGPAEAAKLPSALNELYLLSFDKPYNPELLGIIIANLCECTCSVEPSSMMENGNVEVDVYGEHEATYTFSSTVGKSPYTRFWKYSVAGQVMNYVVHLENEWERRT